MSAIHTSLDPLSPFLAGKKLEFLHNAAMNLDRDLHDDGFFADAADLFSSREEALRVCAPAFEADGMDRFGRPRKRARRKEESAESMKKMAEAKDAEMNRRKMEEIIANIGDTVEILETVKPIYNFKAGGEDAPWMKKK